jgi:hypothetical protein
MEEQPYFLHPQVRMIQGVATGMFEADHNLNPMRIQATSIRRNLPLL